MIDYSNTKDGYVMVQYTAQTTKRLKIQVKGPTTTYTYDLKQGQWTVFPLSDGNGSYQVSVFQNVSGTRYTNELSQSFKVELSDEFAPFLRPNQYVDYSDAVNTLAKAKELTKDITDPLKQVAAIYDYVVKNLSYDYQKAATVKSGYLPVLDTVLAEKKGICFDYASLMTGMVRSLGIPCKLVVGYAVLPITPGSASGRRSPAGWTTSFSSTAPPGSAWTPPSPPPASRVLPLWPTSETARTTPQSTCTEPSKAGR